jgi:O-antigen/teichoic acid export membrane protein
VHTAKLRELASFAGWVAVSTFISPLLLYLDRFMIGVLLSMTAVTFYAAPYEIVGRLVLISGAVMGALVPALSRLSGEANRAEAERLAVRCVVLLVAVLAPAVVLILGTARDGLALWLGPEYAAQSATAMQILAVGLLVNAAAHVPYGLLYSAGRPDLPARFHMIELPIQLVLAWLLIARFGITGAAIAWSARLIIDAALLFLAAERQQLLRRFALRGQMLPSTLGVVALTGAAAIVASAYLSSPTSRLLAGVSLALVCAALLWTLAVSATERHRILALFRSAA